MSRIAALGTVRNAAIIPHTKHVLPPAMTVNKVRGFHMLEKLAEQCFALLIEQAINPNGVERIHPKSLFTGFRVSSNHGVALDIKSFIARQESHAAPFAASGFDPLVTVGFSGAVQRVETLQPNSHRGIEGGERPHPIAVVGITADRGNYLSVQYGRIRRCFLKRPIRVPGATKQRNILFGFTPHLDNMWVTVNGPHIGIITKGPDG